MNLKENSIIFLICIYIISAPLIILSHTPLIYDYSASFNNIQSDMEEVKDFLFSNGLIENITNSELSHMNDVKNLLMLSRISILLLSALLIWNLHKENITKKMLTKASKINLSLITIIAAVIATSFNKAFTLFHEIFFPMGNYTFANDSLLIQLFPKTFFIQISIIWIIIVIIINALVIILARKYLTSNYQSAS